jgi:DNA-binding CsgD family transcriptional regulator/PAS domain-containing protein
MLSQEIILRLIAKFYDAAADRRFWPEFLQEFAQAARGTTTAIIYYDSTLPTANFEAGVNYSEEYGRNYLEYYHKVNPWTRSWKSQLDRPGLDSIGTSEQRVPLRDLEKTEFYNDHLLPHDTIHQVGCMIEKTEHRHSGFTCLRPRQSGPFGQDEVDLLRLLYPHLERAMQFNRRLAFLEGRCLASFEVLDMVAAGVVLLDRAGRILAVNRAAQRVLDQNDGLSAARDGLIASTSDQNQRLRAEIGESVLTSRGSGLSAGGALAIARPSGKRPFSVVIMPASVIAFPSDVGRPSAVVFVNDPEIKADAAPAILRRLYDLTASEARLASLLLQDENLVDAAERLGISHNTARTHLQRIYDKTGTRRQAELVRVLMAGVGGLAVSER